MSVFELSQMEVVHPNLHEPEGVAIDREGYAYCGGAADGVIRRISPDGSIKEIAKTGGHPLGITLDLENNILVCDPGAGALLKVTQEGGISIVADHVGNASLHFPNFCSFMNDGTLFVSNSSRRGWDEVLDPPMPDGTLFAIYPDGSGEVVVDDLWLANGTAIAPDESAVYVMESTRYDIMKVPILGPRKYGTPEIVISGLDGQPDGMAFDASGNLLGTIWETNKVIRVFPDGSHEILLHDPEGTTMKAPANLAFGGPALRTLYVSHVFSDPLLKIDYGAPGAPLYHQR